MASNSIPSVVAEITPAEVRRQIEHAGSFELGILFGRYGQGLSVPSNEEEARVMLLDHLTSLEQRMAENNDFEKTEELRNNIAATLREKMVKEIHLKDTCLEILQSAEKSLLEVDPLMKCQMNLYCKDFMKELETRKRSLEGPLTILIAGPVSAGKSSLLNLILGGDYLPIGRGNTTAVCCEIVNSEKRCLEVVIRGKPRKKRYFDLEDDPQHRMWKQVKTWIRKSTIILDDLKGQVDTTGDQDSQVNTTEDQDSQLNTIDDQESQVNITGKEECQKNTYGDQQDHVEKIVINWPIPFLKREEQVTIVDIPGLFIMDRCWLELSKQIQNIDGFIIVLNTVCDTGLTEQLITFMKDVQRSDINRHGVFLPYNFLFVCNQVDLVPEEDRDGVVSEVFTELKALWPEVTLAQFVESNVSRQELQVLHRSQPFNQRFERIYRSVSQLIHKSKRHKTDATCCCLDSILDRALTLSKTKSTSDKNDVIAALAEDLTAISNCIKNLRIITGEMENEQQQTVDKLAKVLKRALNANKSKLCEWTIDQIPTRNPNSDWYDYNVLFKRLFFQRVKDLISDHKEIQDIYERFVESVTKKLRNVRDLHETVKKSISQELSNLETKAFNGYPLEERSSLISKLMKVAMVLALAFTFLRGIVVFYEGINCFSEPTSEEEFNRDPVGFLQKFCKCSLDNIIGNKLREIANEITGQVPGTVSSMIGFYHSRLSDLHISIQTLKKVIQKETKPTEEKVVAEIEKASNRLKRFIICDVSESTIDEKNVNLITKLGAGMFGSVWKARLISGGRTEDIAVKVVLCPELDYDDGIVFWRELSELRILTAKAGSGVDNFIKFYGFRTGDYQGVFTLHICMELCSCSLADVVKRETLQIPHIGVPEGVPVQFPVKSVSDGRSQAYVINLAQQCSMGLDFLHQNDVVHRDVKPQNFLLKMMPDRHIVKIADLRQARKSSMIATRGNQRGSLLYNAPEVLSSSLHTKACDVYSLALVIWELWHGCTVFKDLSDDILRSTKRPEPPFIDTKPPDCLVKMMRRAFGQAKSRPSARCFIDGLESLKDYTP